MSKRALVTGGMGGLGEAICLKHVLEGMVSRKWGRSAPRW